MKKEKENKNLEEDETVELNIEDLTEIQGGIETDEKLSKDSCGLGCFIGSGSSGPGKPIEPKETKEPQK